MISNAKVGRYEAIGMIVELYMPTSRNYDLTTTDVDEMADNILKLSQLGRTDRWKAVIRQWAGMVRECKGDDVKHLRWAFLQGLVYVNYQV